ncbi:PH domain-containing protein [Halalkalibacter alkaliphilus]|uniref:PH domain-containing protein n=1 Tax=Halalkalibacter alkaliphilus TaxID=2917993 RepID=A0A9X2CWA9_9BACI|nr:PH domain-containing protein [Halalkalibacter alkaliphilus]MCL7749458.1 PH domain-containing protein [Halalkalibacter alkaliphilus]
MIIWVTILLCTIPPIIEREVVTGLITFPLAIFVAWIWYSTGYKIENDRLKIAFGPFSKMILINEIKSVRKTRSLISAPANSLDRLEIMYGKFNLIVISPINQKQFLHFLLTINPSINLEGDLKHLNKD